MLALAVTVNDDEGAPRRWCGSALIDAAAHGDRLGTILVGGGRGRGVTKLGSGTHPEWNARGELSPKAEQMSGGGVATSAEI